MSSRVQVVGCARWRAKSPIFGLKTGQRRDVTERAEANVATFEATSRRYRELD